VAADIKVLMVDVDGVIVGHPERPVRLPR